MHSHKTISGLHRNSRSQERVGQYIQSAERKKNCQSRMSYLEKLSFKKGGEIKTL